LSETTDILVAGGGIAGLTAALHSARLGRNVLLVTGDVLGGHLLSIEQIDGFPGYPDGIAGFELCPITQGQVVEAGAEVRATEISGLSANGDRIDVSLADGEITAGAVVIATGTSLKNLGISGESELMGKGVSHCASCDAPLLRDKPVVVIGGGDSALQEALTLADVASTVDIVHLGDAPIAQDDYRHRAESNAKITFHAGRTVAEILGDDGVTGVRLDNGEELSAEGVFVFVGLAPNTEFLAGSVALDDEGFLLTEANLSTSVPGVFATGTVRAGAAGRAVAAAGDGALVALSAHRYLSERE